MLKVTLPSSDVLEFDKPVITGLEIAERISKSLAKSAVAAGCDGIFIEVHDDPEKALSDSSTQYPLHDLENLIISLQKIKNAL